MRPLLAQIGAITLMNLKSVPQRLWLSLSTIVAVALVVVVLLAFLAMGNGFQHTLASSGSPNVAVVLRGGSRSCLSSWCATASPASCPTSMSRPGSCWRAWR